jgi:hypothetical protein
VATVGLLMMRSYVLASDRPLRRGDPQDAGAGLAVIPPLPAVSTGGPRYPRISRAGASTRMVSLTGFSLIGGPAYNDSAAAVEVLKGLDVPYIAAHPIEFQTLGQWASSDGGLGPVETTMLVALPEIDGATNPTVFGGRHSGRRAATAVPTTAPGRPTARRWRPASNGSTASWKRRSAWPPAAQGECREEGGDRPFRLPAQCRRHRHGGLSERLREPVQHASTHEGRGLRSRGSRLRRRPARRGAARQRQAIRAGGECRGPCGCRHHRAQHAAAEG